MTICSAIFNGESSYRDAALAIMQIPWAASENQVTSYGPSSIIKASNNLSFFDETIEDCEKHLHSLPEDSQISLWNSEACLKKKSRTKLGDTVSKKVYTKTQKILSDGKAVGILGGAKTCSFGGIKASAEKYANLGLLTIDVNPYGKSIPLVSLPGLHKIVAMSASGCSRKQRVESLHYPHVEIFAENYISWMEEGQNSWQTIAYDIVAGLPKYVWVSLDMNVLRLRSFSIEELTQIFVGLVDDGHIITGFDLWGVVPGLQSKVAAKLMYKLSSLLLLSQGILPLRPCNWFTSISEKICEEPSGLLPQQSS
jgi:agmatinase